jgi:transcriptional accessory protein Tex/SPT6
MMKKEELAMRKEPTLLPKVKTEAMLSEVEGELKALVNGVNIAAPPPPIPREITKPEGLGEEIAKAMIESAQAALTEAQNHLQQTQAHAEKIREDVRSWADNHDALVKRFQELGKSMLDSYRTYTNPEKSSGHD